MEISQEKLFESVGPWRSIFEPGTATVETKRERILKGICSFACIIKRKKEEDVIKKSGKSANDYLTQTRKNKKVEILLDMNIIVMEK